MHEYTRKPLALGCTDAKRNTSGVKRTTSTGEDIFRRTEERAEAALLEIVRYVRDYLWYRAQVFNFQQLELTGQAGPEDHHIASGQVAGLRNAAIRLDELLCDAGFEDALPACSQSRFLLHPRGRCSGHSFYRLEMIDDIGKEVDTYHGANRFCGEHSICGVWLFDHDAKHLSEWIPIVTAIYGEARARRGLDFDRLPIDRQLADEYSGREFEDLMNNLPPAF